MTLREFALSRAQAAILRAVGREPDLDRVAAAATGELGTPIPADLVGELLDQFDELALTESPGSSPEAVHTRQREARSEFFSRERGEALGDLLESMRALPYYADVLPDPLPAIERPEDVAHLPILDRSTLRERFPEFLPAGLPVDDVVWMSTSGTTGERQQVARSLADWEAAQPWTWTLNRVIRDVLGGPYCRLTTPRCNGTECHQRPGSREERTNGPRLALETTHEIASLPPDRVERIVREMTEHRPEYLLVDPTYLAILVDHARRLRLPLPRVRFVLTAYELSSALHRRAIEEAFECPVYDAYGATEYGAIAVQCEAGRHHVNPRSVILEVLAGGGAPGRMLVTTLEKKVMPLLRYDTGDLAVRGETPCSCMWSETETLASLEGRAADAVRTTAGALVTAAAVDRAIAPSIRGVVTYCLVQQGPASYRFEFLPAHDHREGALAGAVAALHDLLGHEAKIRTERRREILPAPSGKFRLSYAERANSDSSSNLGTDSILEAPP